MVQPSLFYESVEDAFREVIKAAGGPKVVACQLWPDKTPEAAHRLLLACLNDERPERFNPGHVFMLLRIGREKGCHCAMHFINVECGYAPPTPIEPDDEKARLQRDFIEAVNRLERAKSGLARLGLVQAA